MGIRAGFCVKSVIKYERNAMVIRENRYAWKKVYDKNGKIVERKMKFSDENETKIWDLSPPLKFCGYLRKKLCPR